MTPTAFLVPEIWNQALIDYVSAPMPQWKLDMLDRALAQMKAERSAKRSARLIATVRRLQVYP